MLLPLPTTIRDGERIDVPPIREREGDQRQRRYRLREREQFGCVMVRSGMRAVTYHRCLRRFRRRRLHAFLRLKSLSATLKAMKHETTVLFDVRFLQRLVVDGRWHEALGFVKRFLPYRDDQMGIEAHIVLRFITHLNVLDDLAHDKPPSIITDPHCAEVVSTIFNKHSHGTHRESLDWQFVRLKAAEILKDLVTQIPEFSHLLWLRRCPINLRYTIPFGFGDCRRQQRMNTGRMAAFRLTRLFVPKERRLLARNRGLSSKPMTWLLAVIDEILLAGEQDVKEHSFQDSSSEGIPGALVVSCVDKNCGSSNAGTKRLCQEVCCTECVNCAKRPHATGKFDPDVIGAVDKGWMDPMHVAKKAEDLRDITDAMLRLLTKLTHRPDRVMYADKLLEQARLLHELRADCLKAMCIGSAPDS